MKKDDTSSSEVLIDIEDTSTTIVESDIKFDTTPPISLPDTSVTPKQSFLTNKNTVNFLAGGISGSIASVVTQPLDVLKTRFQSSAKIYNDAATKQNFLLKIIDSLKITAKTEGLHGLFRGLIPNIAGIFPSRAIYFATYSGTKDLMSKYCGLSSDSPLVHIGSAAACGVVVPAVMNPMFLVKTRIQLDLYKPNSSRGSNTPNYNGYMDCISRIYRDEGVKGFYKGLTASFLGIFETAIYFVLYEQVKRMALKSTSSSEGETPKFTPLTYITVSGGCKLVASAITYPHEVVRTRMREIVDGKCRYDKGMINAFKTIAIEEGTKGLYSGMGAHLIRVVPNTAIMFLSFEFITHFMEKHYGTGKTTH
ncbi:hypothetical protein FDP41_012622 [Naegleria fowleri]|uniref:Mitochondrial carrier protein n=1 Tax=Naegleria fowleri TaxID=5763 RepID=A0A6A5C3N8_NAEFO|nr:uncharacterized protein FDP41_012622 [Naegleria fowleri]KAF0981362.1 hypothetical protein FDP41_012622 [Naegleria fowleri]CAG4710019.1 unnamed protein product [Naegleria fowleri]